MAVLAGTPGPRGDRGLPGPVGPRGFDGKRGLTGKNGKDGATGPKGDRGDRGFPGNDGKQGIQGRQGKDGAAGKDGSIAGIEHTLLPSDVASDSTPGAGLTAAARDHTHKGVRSIRADAQPQLFEDVVLASGAGISMSQVGNTITISSSGSGSPLVFTQGLVNILGTVHNTFFTGAGTDQTLYGGADATGSLHLSSTSNATKGKIYFGVGTSGMQYDEPTDALYLPSLNAGGILKTDVTTGLVDLAISGTDYQPPGAYLTALTGDVAAAGPGSSVATIQPGVVDYAKIQTVGASALLGNPTGSPADASEITLGAGLAFSGSTLVSTVSPTSDHKLSIDGSDATYDFLAAKLTATLPITLTVNGSGGGGPPTSGLALWLKADVGVTQGGGTVSAWTDQSPASFGDVTAPGTQPAFNASSINGLPGITFTGAEILTRTRSPLAAGNTPRTIIIVTQTANTTGGCLMSLGQGGPWFGPTAYLFGSSGTLTLLGNTGFGTSTSTDTTAYAAVPLVIEVGWSGSGPITYNMNANPLTIVGADGNADSHDYLTVGNYWNGGFGGLPYSGDICEILIYDHVLSGGDLTAVRQYLQARYAISLGVSGGGSGDETLNIAALFDNASITLNVSNQLQVGAMTGDVTSTAGSLATTISPHAVTYGQMQEASGLSVLGVSGSSTADLAEITATANDQVLQEIGGVLAFHTLDYSQLTGTPAAITDLTGDVVATGPGSAASTIQAGVVSYSKIQAVGASSLLGNPTGSPADASEITLGSGLSFVGSTLVSTVSPTSDHKLSIDGSDTTYDFLAAKLTATLPAVVTVVNPGGAETLDVSVSYDNTSIGTPFSGQLSLIGIPDSTPLAGDIVFPAISAPLTPASGFANVWYDSLAGNLWIENEFSVSTHTAQTESAPTHNFFNALNDDGTFNYAQPDFTDLTGQATYAQIQDETAHTLIGNPGGTLVPPSEITLGAGLQFSGTTLVNTIAAAITQLTGDVAAGPGSGSQAATIQSHVVQFAKMQQIGAQHLVGNPTGSTADISEFALGVGLDFHNYGTGLTLRNSSPLSDLAVTAPLQLSGTTIGWSGLGANLAMYANTVGTPGTDSTFTFDPTNKILGAEAIGINGVTPSANQYLAGGNATNSVRAQVAWFVGGSSSPDNPDNTLFLISQNSGATIPAGRTTGIWATARVQPNGYSGTSTPHITEATTLYVDGAPTLTGAVGSLYAFHVAGGASKLDGSLALPGISGVPSSSHAHNPTMVDNAGNVTAIPQILWDDSALQLSIGTDTTNWPYILSSPTDGVDGGYVAITGTNTVVAGTGSTLRSIQLGGGVANINGTTNITRLDQIYVSAPHLNGVTAGSTATTATTLAISGAPDSSGVTHVVNYTRGYALDVLADATHLGGALVTEGGTVATGGSGGDIIPNALGNVLFITGTTSFQTIKSTTYKDGSIIVLWFTSNVTALHNTAGAYTSMSLKGGVNASCLANTCLTLLLKSGSWYEVSRSF